jgi:hypothetical protein
MIMVFENKNNPRKIGRFVLITECVFDNSEIILIVNFYYEKITYSHTVILVFNSTMLTLTEIL